MNTIAIETHADIVTLNTVAEFAGKRLPWVSLLGRRQVRLVGRSSSDPSPAVTLVSLYVQTDKTAQPASIDTL